MTVTQQVKLTESIKIKSLIAYLWERVSAVSVGTATSACLCACSPGARLKWKSPKERLMRQRYRSPSAAPPAGPAGTVTSRYGLSAEKEPSLVVNRINHRQDDCKRDDNDYNDDDDDDEYKQVTHLAPLAMARSLSSGESAGWNLWSTVRARALRPSALL